jgi:hypothetical protein
MAENIQNKRNYVLSELEEMSGLLIVMSGILIVFSGILIYKKNFCDSDLMSELPIEVSGIRIIMIIMPRIWS